MTAVQDAISHAQALQMIKLMGDLLEQLAREWQRQADAMDEIEDDGYAAARRDPASELLAAINRGGTT